MKDTCYGPCFHCGSPRTRAVDNMNDVCLDCGRYSNDPVGTPARPLMLVHGGLSSQRAAVAGPEPEELAVAPPKYADREYRPCVFVFGSNLMGKHGAGAAKYAVAKLGAIYRREVGRQGCSYAIPTLDRILTKLPLEEIKKHVDEFIQYAIEHNDEDFFLTRIGTGLAGFRDEEIAPMFKNAPPNVIRPIGWE